MTMMPSNFSFFGRRRRRRKSDLAPPVLKERSRSRSSSAPSLEELQQRERRGSIGVRTGRRASDATNGSVFGWNGRRVRFDWDPDGEKTADEEESDEESEDDQMRDVHLKRVEEVRLFKAHEHTILGISCESTPRGFHAPTVTSVGEASRALRVGGQPNSSPHALHASRASPDWLSRLNRFRAFRWAM